MQISKTARIQLFDDSGIISDRLVKQGPEFYLGPKEVHKGPMRIEFTFSDKDDVDGAINYIKCLRGDLPLKNKTTSGVAKKSVSEKNDTDFDDNKEKLVIKTIEDNKDNQDTLIMNLRDMGFVFIESNFLKHIIPEAYSIKELHLNKYEWLVKRIKLAKDPKNDKYDPQILVGISIMNKRSDRVILYSYGEYKSKYISKVPEKKALKLTKTNLIKFPPYMEEDERLKWGFEHRILFNDKNKKPSKFYMRWSKDVIVGDELKIEKDELQKRFEA